MSLLRIVDLTKKFEGTPAVRGLCLNIAEGEFVSLLGPSGCGKSTTLSLIAGFEQLDSGEILVEGRRIDHLEPRRRPVGVVLQDFAIFPRMSVAQNIAFGLAARGIGRAERDCKVKAIAGRLGIVPLLPLRGSDLDLASMQRVAIARTAVTEPRILLLDEPLSSLDATVRDQLRDELKWLQAAIGQTVLYVTHDQGEALALSDRVAVMSAGRILQIDVPRRLYEHPVDRFVAGFVGEPPINLLPATLSTEGGAVVIRPAGFPPLRWRGQWNGPSEALLAVRPQGIELDPAGPHGVPAVVEDVEIFGAVASLVVSAAGVRLNTAAGRAGHQAGDAVGLRLCPAGTLLIDPHSGRMLARIEAAELS